MSLPRIREQYGVPARRGMRVEYAEGDKRLLGSITSARGGRVYVRLDKYPNEPMPFHPTVDLRYIESAGSH
jgi:hypothetical protein